MTSEMSSASNSKKRRIMIITADESIIEQIQANCNGSLLKSIILDSDGDNVEFSHSNINNTQSSDVQPTNSKKQKTGLLTCVVCGSPANGYNFDAISCESCKAFFRRNALKDPKTFECRRSSDCDVTLESRRRCAGCRLQKCLKNGMTRDRLLTSEQKAIKLRQIEENRNSTLKINSNNDKLSLKIDPEIIEEKPQKLFSKTDQEIVEEKPQKLSSKIDQKIKEEKPQLLKTVDSAHVATLENTNLLFTKDVTDLLRNESSLEPRTPLSPEDLQRVETIKLSYEQRIEFAARDGLPWDPSVYATTVLEQVNSRSVSALRLISFFKQVPEFNEINVQDRITLIKYNLMPLTMLNYTLSYNTETATIREAEVDAPWDTSILSRVHGEDICKRAKKIFDSFVGISQNDPRIMQLALIILVLTKGFSTNSGSSEPILDDGIAVYRAQNFYTELLWKYLEAKYGYGEAIDIFNKLVMHFISWQTLHKDMAHNFFNVLTPAEVNELLPIMKSLIHIPQKK
ncbi:unnamed protein product [Adineta steineri]|uniref:Uncharacterized protein n=1 Tax=Adineta steineri TaxID=433720 RepID=A0A814NQH2_9BILA|nr:unnamed protein product [Adineta steineri]CAF1275006.1 unnamed protein product [Adineta steineri]CAF1464616.1 unnamed protein product [Adineta steineri]